MLTMLRVRSVCIGIAPVAGVALVGGRSHAFVLGNYELMALAGAQREPPPLLADDLARKGVLEVAMTEALMNLGQDAVEGTVDREGGLDLLNGFRHCVSSRCATLPISV